MKIIFPNDKGKTIYIVYAIYLSDPLDTVYIHMPGEYEGIMPVRLKDVEVVENHIDDTYQIEFNSNSYSMVLHWSIKDSSFLTELVERRRQPYQKFLHLISKTYLENMRDRK